MLIVAYLLPGKKIIVQTKLFALLTKVSVQYSMLILTLIDNLK